MPLRFLAILLLASGCLSHGPSYPEAYLLEGDEIPDRLIVPMPTAEEWPEEWGDPDNPFQVPKSAFQTEIVSQLGIYGPEEIWMQLLRFEERQPDEDSDFIVLSGRWDDRDDANRARELVVRDWNPEECHAIDADRPTTYFLQDGKQIVLAFADGSSSDIEKMQLLFIVRALTSKTPGLDEFLRICG
jgi:hypothetical protein